jgi:hypothetical protein
MSRIPVYITLPLKVKGASIPNMSLQASVILISKSSEKNSELDGDAV